MMKKKTSIILGILLLLIAVIFVGVAVSHPELSVPWSLRATYMFYGFYVWLLFRFLLVTPFFSKKQDEKKCGSILRAIVVTGSLDIAFESIYLFRKKRG